MKETIKALFRQNRWGNIILECLSFLRNSTLLKIRGKRKKFPEVIQLPLTYKCNSRCVMCNIWKMRTSKEASPEDLRKYLQDDIFREVKSVGINGGEPSIVSNLPLYVTEILKLPKLQGLNLISNGLAPNLLLPALKKIYSQCQQKGISFHVSISLDGLDMIHDQIRGIPGAFKKTIGTIDEIKKNQTSYCNSLDIGCTVVKQNVEYLAELESFAKLKGYNIKYRLGIKNRRIDSQSITDQYSVLGTGFEQSAREFFYSKMLNTAKLADKFKYFAIFYWLANPRKRRRLLGCAWRENGITLDSLGKIYYCAVASKALGDLKIKRGTEIFFSPDNLKYRQKILQHCNECIHDYSGRIWLPDFFPFLKEWLKNRYAMKLYLYKKRLLP